MYIDNWGSALFKWPGGFLFRGKVVKVKKLIGRSYRLEVLLIFGSSTTYDTVKTAFPAPDWQLKRFFSTQVMPATGCDTHCTGICHSMQAASMVYLASH